MPGTDRAAHTKDNSNPTWQLVHVARRPRRRYLQVGVNGTLRSQRQLEYMGRNSKIAVRPGPLTVPCRSEAAASTGRSRPDRAGSAHRFQPEIELSPAVVTMHHTWQAERPTRQFESLRGAAVGARRFGQFEDFALPHPDDAEREARAPRPARRRSEPAGWEARSGPRRAPRQRPCLRRGAAESCEWHGQ